MILKYLSSSAIQSEIGEAVLSRLETLLPAISIDIDATDVYNKDTLVKILTSFSTESLFKKKDFLSLLIDSIPTDHLKKLSSELDIPFTEFRHVADEIVSRGWTDTSYCESFCNAAGLPNKFAPKKPGKFVQHEIAAASSSPYKRLKNYQTAVFEKAKANANKQLARFVMQMPTGSGKTRTAMELVAELLNENPNQCVVWLAHSGELCEQAIECFKHVWEHVGQIDTKIYRCWGSSKGLPFDNSASTFLVCGFQKLHSLLQKNEQSFHSIKDDVALIVVDEAHKVVAPSYDAVTKALIGETTRVIGLTATPGRSIVDEAENRKLSKFFFEEKVTISVPDDGNVIEYLREQEILSNVVREPLLSQRTYELTNKQKSFVEKSFDFPPGFLAKLSDDDFRNLEIIKKLIAEAEAGRKILFFACSIDHSKFICALLTYFKIEARHVDGTTSKGEREVTLNQFKQGELDVVCNYGVLTTGFDAPKTDVVFIARPTTSIVLYSQMIGRGLRGPAIGGTENCKVIEVVDNIIGMPPESRIFDYFDDYWVNSIK